MLLSQNQLPSEFTYPSEFLYVYDSGVTNLGYWYILDGDEQIEKFDGLKERYPDKQYIPFAIAGRLDDTACWMPGKGGEIFIVHDFASPGWEQMGDRFPDFWTWFRFAIEEMIKIHEDRIAVSKFRDENR